MARDAALLFAAIRLSAPTALYECGVQLDENDKLGSFAQLCSAVAWCVVVQKNLCFSYARLCCVEKSTVAVMF